MAKGSSPVSHKPYIGTRDFYPEDMEFRNWMFGRLRAVCENYGYREYGAPVLEPVSLYEIKSSEEIVNEQLYRFTDRGDRNVAIRPEMTPTLARLVAARIKQLPRPLRWYSIANFMRYERPGRGRLREFFQLNVDLIGCDAPTADAEIFTMGLDLLRSFGAPDEAFVLRFNDRRILDGWFRDLAPEQLRVVGRLLDKKDKIGAEEFEKQLGDELKDPALVKEVFAYLELTVDGLVRAAEQGRVDEAVATNLQQLTGLMESARKDGSLPVEFAPGIVRGFDYYTGVIFEIYDRHPENQRALFGGGRYDRLIGLFGKEDVPAVGFGMGDVTLENFITGHGLKPQALEQRRGIYLTLFGPEQVQENQRLLAELRGAGLPVESALEPTKKLGKQFELAEKKGRRLVLIMGAEEVANEVVRVKDLADGQQEDVEREFLAERLRILLASPAGGAEE